MPRGRFNGSWHIAIFSLRKIFFRSCLLLVLGNMNADYLMLRVSLVLTAKMSCGNGTLFENNFEMSVKKWTKIFKIKKGS